MTSEKATADAEYVAVVALPAPQRYSYFPKQTADWEAVWSLHAPDGWALSGAADAQVLVPVWPHARYAAACAVGRGREARLGRLTSARGCTHGFRASRAMSAVLQFFPFPMGRE